MRAPRNPARSSRGAPAMNDPMAEAAREAAMMVTKLDFKLLGAAAGGLSRPERMELLASAFQQWAALCRRMSALEQIAPNSAQLGYARDRQAQNVIEGGAA